MPTDCEIGWVRELVQRKSARPHTSLEDKSEEALALAFSTLRSEIWREIIAVVAAYNDEVGYEELIVALQAEGRIGIAKYAYPAGYLEVIPDRDRLRFAATVGLRKDAASPFVERTVEGGCVIRDGTPRLLWAGAELSVPEIVRQVMTPFFDEI